MKATRAGSPNTTDVVRKLFELAPVAVVLFTPDDEVRLHEDLVPTPDLRGEHSWSCQPRPNVFLEAGMALAAQPERTIFVEIGVCRVATDVEGLSFVRLDGTAGPIQELAERLRTAGAERQRGRRGLGQHRAGAHPWTRGCACR